MKHVHYTQVEGQAGDAPGVEGVQVRWLISSEDGAPTFYMRRFELEPGGHTPRHTHPWEHEVYILEGEGTVLCEAAEERFRPGDVIYIPGGEEHRFVADAGGAVAFLCLIPKEGKPD